MGESRNELLKWINDLCKLNYTKLEQVGTGAAYCQIIDSIYRDVPLKRVKFNAKSESEYLDNYKILNASFNKHKIDKIIPTLDLVKLRMQDNLLFTQWLKKFWDTNFPGDEYDAVKRRNSTGVGPSVPSNNVTSLSNKPNININVGSNTPLKKNNSVTSNLKTSRPPTVQSTNNVKTTLNNIKKPTSRSNTANNIGNRTPSAMSNTSNNALQNKSKVGTQQTSTSIKSNNNNNSFETKLKELSNKLDTTREQLNQIQDERDFYFGKLQLIEELIQTQQANLSMDIKHLLNTVENILYATQEGYDAEAQQNQQEMMENNIDTNVLEEGLDDLEFPEDEHIENNNNIETDNNETF